MNKCMVEETSVFPVYLSWYNCVYVTILLHTDTYRKRTDNILCDALYIKHDVGIRQAIDVRYLNVNNK